MHEDCIRAEPNNKLSLIPDHNGNIMGIFMGLAKLSGLDHILHVEASSVVDSRLGMSTLGQNWRLNYDHEGTWVPVVIQLDYSNYILMYSAIHSVSTWKEICKIFQIYKTHNSKRYNNSQEVRPTIRVSALWLVEPSPSSVVFLCGLTNRRMESPYVSSGQQLMRWLEP